MPRLQHSNTAQNGGIFIDYCRDDRSEQNMKDQSNSGASQRQRILEWLRIKPLTTLQARQQLDIMHPAARVSELKADGNNIVTHWTEDSSGKGKHKVAQYVLLANQA